MSHTTSLLLSWSWSLMTMPTSSFTSTTPPSIQLGRTTPSGVPSSRPLVAVGRRINRIRCSATYTLAPSRESTTTTTTAVGEARRAQGAAVLALGTANPAATCLPQTEYADWYFRATKRDHLTKLKAKMKKICKILTWWFHFRPSP
jgi:hypothetical protein